MTDIKSLVERLKEYGARSTIHPHSGTWMLDAAEVIEQQAARIAELEAENRKLAEFVVAVGGIWGETKSKLVGELSLAEVINRAFEDSADDSAMAKDAERWRWLKMRSSVGEQQRIMSTPWGQWDAFADAAIAAKENP